MRARKRMSAAAERECLQLLDCEERKQLQPNDVGIGMKKLVRRTRTAVQIGAMRLVPARWILAG